MTASVVYLLTTSEKRSKSADRHLKKKRKVRKSVSDDESSLQIQENSALKDSNYTPGRDSSILDSDDEEVKRQKKKQKKYQSKQVLEI